MSIHKLFEDRDITHQLSKTNSTGGCITIFGIIGMLAFGASLILLINDPSSLTVDPDLFYFPILLLLLTVISAFGYLVYSSLQKVIKIKKPHFYNPKTIAIKGLFQMAIGLLFMICFLTPFILLGFTHQIMFGVVGGILLLFGLIGTVMGIKKGIQLLQEAKKYESSNIEVLNGPTVRRGEVLKFKFHNKLIEGKLNNLDIILRNLEEKWEVKTKGSKKDRNLQTYIIYSNQLQQEVPTSSFECQFSIPMNARTTIMSVTNPCYWELEISNKEQQFYTRFFINVI